MIKPVLQIGKFAIMADDSHTTVYDVTTGEALFNLTAAGEYALVRMLLEKAPDWTSEERACGESIYRELVLPAARQIVLS